MRTTYELEIKIYSDDVLIYHNVLLFTTGSTDIGIDIGDPDPLIACFLV